MSKTSCVHFTGVQNTHCKMGVPYVSFGQPAIRVMPCFSANAGKPDVQRCDACRYPTPEEVNADKEAMLKAMETHVKLLGFIGPWRKAHRGTDHAEFTDCPICKGKKTLRLSIVAYNSHMRGNCSTPKCVSWME
jgi:hypothetical protein